MLLLRPAPGQRHPRWQSDIQGGAQAEDIQGNDIHHPPSPHHPPTKGASSTASTIQGGTLTRAIMEPNLSTTIVIQGGSGATKTMHRPETSKDTPSAAIRATSIQAIAIHHILSCRHPLGAGVICRQLSRCQPPTSTNQVGTIHRHRGGTSFISAIAEAPPSEQMQASSSQPSRKYWEQQERGRR